MAPRGRVAGFTMSHEHRSKIANSNIIRYLLDHAEGKREMSPTQIQAALGLLKKVMPDLAASATAALDSEEGKQILGWHDGSEDADKGN